MKLIRFFMPRLEYILFAAIFWGIAATGPILLNSDGDLPRHILVGKLIRATHTVPLTDIFSFRTTGFPSIPHEWLSQVILSGFYDLMGLGGIVLFTTIIVTIVWAIIFYDALHRSKSLLLSLAFTGLGVAASLIHILPRPHLFSYLFTTLWILVLEQIRKDKTRKWWLLPAMMLIWVNLHGMFVLGIVIGIIYIIGDFFENPSKTWFASTRTRSLLAGILISIPVTFLSPSGYQIWGAIVALGGDAYIKSRIPEYQSANFQMAETWPFILLLLLCIMGFARAATKTNWTHAFLVTAFAGAALYSSRILPFFAIVTTPIATELAAGWLKQDFPNNHLFATEVNLNKINETSNGMVWIFAVVLTVTVLFKYNIAIDPANKGNNFDPSFFPVQATTWLASHPQTGHVFNEFDWGGYLLLKLWPKYQIFMDGHTHIYGEKLTREYEQVITLSNGWEDVLNKYQVKWAMIRAKSPLVNALEQSHWQIIYQDDTTIILRKPG